MATVTLTFQPTSATGILTIVAAVSDQSPISFSKPVMAGYTFTQMHTPQPGHAQWSYVATSSASDIIPPIV